ncbi:hypothetical protein ABID56_000987 [Alkalibacillus flavidus]|uniref:Uncharacterized protein n=1 Tax=Alkalibacillus flavidus TaxID=546021 RepID=A0ABV2KTJ6_9BACI
MYSELIQPFWILFVYLTHGLLALLLLILVNKRVDKEEKGVFTWILMISLFIPLIAEVFGLMAWYIAQKIGVNNMMDDYDEYITYKPLMLDRLKHEARISYDILPLSESLTDGEAIDQQETVMRLISSNITEKGRYLNLGLTNTNSEMVHYAAATINLLVDKHEKELALAKERYVAHDAETLDDLLSAYERFINSGLLEESSQRKLEQEYQELLKTEVIGGNEDPRILQKLGQMYLSWNDEVKGVEIMEKLIARFPEDPQGYLTLIRYYYEKKEWKRLREVLLSMRRKVPIEKIPKEQRYVLQQMWGDFS